MGKMMDAKVIGEFGYKQALFGLGLSYGLTTGKTFAEFIKDENKINRLGDVAKKLCVCDGGHNKFLESIRIWLDVTAPRFWFSEADTYRLTTKQSESTMHTLVKELSVFCDEIKKKFKTREEFLNSEYTIKNSVEIADYVNVHFDTSDDDTSTVLAQVICLIESLAFVNNDEEKLLLCKRALPESYLQRREWLIDYKTFRNIVFQRDNHRLPHWRIFISSVMGQIEHPELIRKELKLVGGFTV